MMRKSFHIPYSTFHIPVERWIAGSLVAVFVLGNSSAEAASSWNPTLLVNTEAFQTIDDSDTAANPTLTFGSSLNQQLFYDRSNNRFQFTRDLKIAGNVTVTGSLLVNIGASTATATTALEVIGTMSGTALRAININNSASAATGSVLIGQAGNIPLWKSPVASMVWYIDDELEAGNEQGAIVTMPFGFTPTSVTLRAKGAPTGAALIVDINENGTSIFSTRPQINDESTTGGSSAVISDTTLAKDSEIRLDLDQVGSTYAGSGLTIQLTGTRKF